jgi:hypothetical protein
MSRNGSGTYNLPAGNPVVTGTSISSSWANTTLSDIANALTGSIAADGQTPISGNLNLAGNKIISLGTGTLATDAANVEQVTSAVAITGGTIDGTPIGSVTPASGKFTTLESTGAGTIGGDLGVTGNGTFSGTSSLKIPAGTTAQRPVSPSNSMLRYNSDYGTFEGYASGAWSGLGGASGASGNAVFYENDTNVTASYTITSGKNAMSAGPITIDDSVTVTVPDNSTWVIV